MVNTNLIFIDYFRGIFSLENLILSQVLCLFKLEFIDQGRMMKEVMGKPIYLAMAHDADKCLKFKPQNLLINLPLAEAS